MESFFDLVLETASTHSPARTNPTKRISFSSPLRSPPPAIRASRCPPRSVERNRPLPSALGRRDTVSSEPPCDPLAHRTIRRGESTSVGRWDSRAAHRWERSNAASGSAGRASVWRPAIDAETPVLGLTRAPSRLGDRGRRSVDADLFTSHSEAASFSESGREAKGSRERDDGARLSWDGRGRSYLYERAARCYT